MRIFILYSLMCFTFFSNTIAQKIKFTDLSSLPNARSAINSANDGNNIYVINGFGISQPYTSEVFKYNILLDEWGRLTSITIPKRYASSEVINNKLYVFNGELSNGSINNNVEIINLIDSSISFSVSQHPYPGRGAGSAVWYDQIYSFGGSNGALFSNRLYVFDPYNEIWTRLADMPIAVESKGEIIDGKLYVFGGFNGANSNEIQVYDVLTNTWGNSIPMPVFVSANSTAIIADKIYLTGDYSNLTFAASFNTLDSNFQIIESNMIDRRHCASEGINDLLYVIGGNTSSSIQSSINSVQVSDLVLSDINDNIYINDKLFPNPTDGYLYFDIEFDSFHVVDLNGKLIETVSEKISFLDVRNYSNGEYIIVLKRGDKIMNFKWTKINQKK